MIEWFYRFSYISKPYYLFYWLFELHIEMMILHIVIVGPL